MTIMRPEPLDALVMRPPAHAPADYDELLDGKLGSTLAWPLSCAKYKIVRPLGQGTFSTCFLAQRSSAWEPTQLVALKVTPRYTDPAKVPAREIEIAMLLVRQPASKLGPSASRHALLTSIPGSGSGTAHTLPGSSSTSSSPQPPPFTMFWSSTCTTATCESSARWLLRTTWHRLPRVFDGRRAAAISWPWRSPTSTRAESSTATSSPTTA